MVLIYEHPNAFEITVLFTPCILINRYLILYSTGLTALEVWCLACLGLVFEAFLSYVIILVKMNCSNVSTHGLVDIEYSAKLSQKRNVKLELSLFIGNLGSAVLFNICYWIMVSKSA